MEVGYDRSVLVYGCSHIAFQAFNILSVPSRFFTKEEYKALWYSVDLICKNES